MLREMFEDQVIQIVTESKQRLALFLGAGASVSSGVPAAGAMIDEWRAMAHRYARTAEPLAAWCQQQDWYRQENEYSALFAELYPNPQLRQNYIERKVASGRPGWGYLYLANLIAHDWFRVALTTNFDNLLAEALSTYAGVVPVVCAADSEVMSVSLASQRPKVIKLHGDYLFVHQKHTAQELQELGGNMKVKFEQITQSYGLLALGYGGRDHSIMGPLKADLARPESFGPGIYWGLWRDEPPSSMVAELAALYPERFHLFRYDDFDIFAATLHHACDRAAGVPLPSPVLDPYGSLKATLRGLVEGAGPAADADVIRADRALLQTQLDRTELLQAQAALARRQHGTALQSATAFSARHPDDSLGQLVWASALTQRAEDTGAEGDATQAIEHLREAVRLDPQNVAALYGLTMHYMRREMDDDALATGEALLEHVPKDKALRTNLAMVYLKKGRVAEAAKQLQACLKDNPHDAQVHGVWSTLMVRNGNTVEALKAIDEAIRLRPGNAAFHSHRGQILATMMRLQDAVAAFDEALRIDPRDHFTRLALARCHLAQGGLDPAAQQVELALQDNPDSVEATGLLGQLHMQSGRFAQALEYFDRLVRMTPQDGRSWSSRGQLLMQMQRPADAERDLLKAAELNPREPSFLAGLAWLYRMTGRGDRLQAVMAEMHRLAPQAAQMLHMQMQMAMQGPMGALPSGVPGAAPQAPGVLQRFIDALK